MGDTLTAPSPLESSTSISTTLEETSERPKKARRTFLTQNACTRCRQKKSKCDGKRPTCGRCEKNNAECVYDVPQEGITRMQNLQQLLGQRTEDHDRLMKLFNAFKSGSDSSATNLLARLRLGESIESLVAHVDLSHASPMGIREPSSPLQDSVGMHSWPTTPLDQESWASWDTRGHSVDGTLAHSSHSTSDTPRASRSFQGVGAILPGPRSPHSISPVDRFDFQSRQEHGGYQGAQRQHFSPVNWQRQDGEMNPFSPPQPLSERPIPDGRNSNGSPDNERKAS